MHPKADATAALHIRSVLLNFPSFQTFAINFKETDL